MFCPAIQASRNQSSGNQIFARDLNIHGISQANQDLTNEASDSDFEMGDDNSARDEREATHRGGEMDLDVTQDAATVESSESFPSQPAHDVDDVLLRLHQLLLTIRNSRRFDRSMRASRFTYNGSEEFRTHMNWYMSHVFKKAYPEVKAFIVSRLLEANVNRRNQFEYAREHSRKLAQDVEKTSEERRRLVGKKEVKPPPGDGATTNSPAAHEPSKPGTKLSPQKDAGNTSVALSSTMATGDTAKRSQARSLASSRLTGKTFVPGNLPWPRPPQPPQVKYELPTFTCPYCWKPLPIEYSSDKSQRGKWR